MTKTIEIKRGMSVMDVVMAMQAGMSDKEIERKLRKIDIEASKEEGKCFGKCESCGYKTCLVEEVGLCGPCCFGEAKTANGNW